MRGRQTSGAGGASPPTAFYKNSRPPGIRGERGNMSDFERTTETIAINAALQIVRLKGDVKFLSKDGIGYYQPTGYCFLHPEKGYFAFAGDDTPYIPRGGKKALLQIMDKGGFIDFDTAVWLQPISA